MLSIRILFAILLLVSVSFTACVSSKRLTEKAQYFRNVSDSMLQKTTIEYEPTLQKGDILSIGVFTPNEKSSRLFNQSFGYGGGTETPTGVSASMGNLPQGYLVNEKGAITFPYLGQIRAAGLTRMALTDTLSRRLQQYIDSAIVSVRLLNYRITVLGEVTHPGTFSIPNERVSVLDAIGLAGDLTVFGRRNNIRIIRYTDGVRQTATLDLNSGDIFGSPFFYLRQNDIVYIEMNNRKIPNSDQTSIRNVSLALGIISAVGVIISTINVLR